MSHQTDFLTELKRRSAAYRSGQTSARLASEVLAEMRQRQTNESARQKHNEDKDSGQ